MLGRVRFLPLNPDLNARVYHTNVVPVNDPPSNVRSSIVRYSPKSTLVASLLVHALTLAGNASAQSFVLKTTEAGLGDLAGLNGVSVADYDMDGDLDL